MGTFCQITDFGHIIFSERLLKADMWQVCAQAGCLEMVVKRFTVTESESENNIVVDYFRRSKTPKSCSR